MKTTLIPEITIVTKNLNNKAYCFPDCSPDSFPDCSPDSCKPCSPEKYCKPDETFHLFSGTTKIYMKKCYPDADCGPDHSCGPDYDCGPKDCSPK